MKKNWKLKEKGDEKLINELSESLNINKILAQLLVQRNITTFEEAKNFFRPQFNMLHDPFLMKDMDLAVERLHKAITQNEKILVYGDYDVDGTTSVALMYSFLERRYKNVDYYIPDRYNEGYGISFKGIDYAAENNCSLIIALDCGIKAVEKIAYANEKNIDFIICDHHTPGEKIPEAIAVLDPKRNDCDYPFKELSGCGVGFKLIQAYVNKYVLTNSSFTNDDASNVEAAFISYLDLACVSIASDIVPIVGENRILMSFGLQRLNNNPRIGLKSLIDIAGTEGKVLSVSDVVFKIGPRINAAGRIESGRKAVELLISEDIAMATDMSDKINENNVTRKKLDSEITEEALKIIGESEELKNKKTTVVCSPNWHKGVIGIVASRLTETYYRPTIVLTESHEKVTGSARSVEGFNLYNALEACSDLFVNFGGHKYAAGLTLEKNKLSEFQQRFETVVSETITTEQLTPKIHVDAKLKFSDIDKKFFQILKQFVPFGPQNMTPVFVSENVKDTGGSKIVGKTKEHLRLEVIDDSNKKLTGIAFFQAEHIDNIKKGLPFQLCYTIEENIFRETVSLQLMIKDIKFD